MALRVFICKLKILDKHFPHPKLIFSSRVLYYNNFKYGKVLQKKNQLAIQMFNDSIFLLMEINYIACHLSSTLISPIPLTQTFLFKTLDQVLQSTKKIKKKKKHWLCYLFLPIWFSELLCYTVLCLS